MNSYTFQIEIEHNGLRIDKWLSEQDLEITRSAVQKLIEKSCIKVNSSVIANSYKLKVGDTVEVSIPDPVDLDVKAQNLPIEIVYQDDDLLVVNKPKGMVVHPALGNADGTLVNALLYHCQGKLSSINGVIRPGIVHRIDKDTSGLLIVAKNDFTHVKLAEQIKAHTLTREYEAILCGRLKEQNGTIKAPIGRDSVNRKKKCVTEKNSKDAITHFEVMTLYPNHSYVKFILETGRTHQIRVHASYIGHPVYGDEVYGKPIKGLQGQCLHAKKLGFIHPRTEEYMEFNSELPEYFLSVLNKLK